MQHHINDVRLRKYLDLETDVQPIKESLLTNFEGPFTGIFYLQLTSVVSPVFASILENFYIEKRTVRNVLTGLTDLFTADALRLCLVIIQQFYLNILIERLALSRRTALWASFVANIIVGFMILNRMLSTMSLDKTTLFLVCLVYIDAVYYVHGNSIMDLHVRPALFNPGISWASRTLCVLQLLLSVITVCVFWELIFLPGRLYYRQQRSFFWLKVGKVLMTCCPSSALLSASIFITRTFSSDIEANWKAFDWIDFNTIPGFWTSLFPNMYGIPRQFLLRRGCSRQWMQVICFSLLGLSFQWIHTMVTRNFSIQLSVKLVILLGFQAYIATLWHKPLPGTRFLSKCIFFFALLSSISYFLLSVN